MIISGPPVMRIDGGSMVSPRFAAETGKAEDLLQVVACYAKRQVQAGELSSEREAA